MTNENWMQIAIELAKQAAKEDEVPVGAILVQDNEIIGKGWNQSIQKHDPTAHAEIMAIRSAGKRLANYRLPNTKLYVTLEPCSMCVGAIIHARIAELIFAANDQKTGAVNSAISLLQHPTHNHKIKITAGVMQSECSTLLKSFFKQRRQQKKFLYKKT